MKSGVKKKLVLPILIALVALCAAAVFSSAAPAQTGFLACVKLKNPGKGLLRLASTGSCRGNERGLFLNQQGPTGPAGTPGGPAGPQGPVGPQGPGGTGPAGPAPDPQDPQDPPDPPDLPDLQDLQGPPVPAPPAHPAPPAQPAPRDRPVRVIRW